MRTISGFTAFLTIAAASTALAQTPMGAPPQTLNSEYQQRTVQGSSTYAPPYSQQSGSATVTATSGQPGPIDSVGSGATPTLPIDVQSSNGINYLTGGIGDEEEAVLKSKYNQFNVHLLMSAPDGAYVSEVSIRVLDAHGNEVMTASDTGPYFYTQLKPGSYTFEATAKSGEIKKFKVTAGAKGGVKEHVIFKQG